MGRTRGRSEGITYLRPTVPGRAKLLLSLEAQTPNHVYSISLSGSGGGTVGMGRELAASAAAKSIFDKANDILGYDL